MPVCDKPVEIGFSQSSQLLETQPAQSRCLRKESFVACTPCDVNRSSISENNERSAP